jgi:hypothetical protein
MRRGVLFLIGWLALSFSSALAQPASGFLRIAHLSVDAPALNVALDGVVLWNALDFPMVTDWSPLSAGSYTLSMTDPTDPDQAQVASVTVDVGANQWVTVALTGYAGWDALHVQTITEDYSTIRRGETRIVALHAIPDAGELDLFADDVALATQLQYAGTAPADEQYGTVDLVAGQYRLYALDAGVEIASSNRVMFGAERAYLFVVAGTPANPQYVLVSTHPAEVIGGEQAAPVVTGSGPLTMRAGHFAPDLPSVDLYLNGEKALSGLSFGTVTDYSTLTAGTYEAALVPAGGTLADALHTQSLALVENSLTLLALVGYQADSTLQMVTASEEAEAVPAGMTRIAFFQAVRSDQLFDLRLNDSLLIQGLLYPNVFNGGGDGYIATDIMPGSYHFTIVSNGTSVDAGTILTGAGRVYLVVALGTMDALTYLLVPGNLPE